MFHHGGTFLLLLALCLPLSRCASPNVLSSQYPLDLEKRLAPNETLMAQERVQRRSIERTRLTYALQNFDSESDLLDVETEPSDVHHPFWLFEWNQLSHYQVAICCFVLFAAGVLCAAGGIGGGGIYVTVLMVAGKLSVADAVPLSKAIVFFGSISSLILNVRKKSNDNQAQSLIDYNLCRLVVPSSLLGTFLGVFFNRHLPSWLILAVLALVLFCITLSVGRTTWKQYMEECSFLKPPDVWQAAANAGKDPRAANVGAAELGVEGKQVAEKALEADAVRSKMLDTPKNTGPMRSRFTTLDLVIAFSMLTIVVVFGMFRYHAGDCLRASPPDRAQACNHPSCFWLGHGTMETWMQNPTIAQFIRSFSFAFPLCFCLAVGLYYISLLVAVEGWKVKESLQYSCMAIFTGCLAGLVGIGGGLIFSPFFLIMGVEPAVAVATSSTCVIFTSSSTSMQYLLTDRVIMSLTVVYGVVNLIASYAGTSFTHFLQDKFATRKSYISLIVGAGVFISMVLSIIKLVSHLEASLADHSAAAHGAASAADQVALSKAAVGG